MIVTSTRLFDLLLPGRIEHLPEELLRYKRNGEWLYYSPQKVHDMAFSLAYFLLQKGINGMGSTPEEKEKLGLICFSRPNWVVSDLATQLTGALLVPLYPNISTGEIITIFNETRLKICFLGDMELYRKIMSIKQELPYLQDIYVFDGATGDLDWHSLVQKPLEPEQKKLVLDMAATISGDEVATIIYTSGTTGTPKGVMLSHKNILSNIKIVSSNIIPQLVLSNNRSLSFLPLNHILEKMIMYVYLFNNFSVSFAESIDTIAQNLQEVKPSIFVTVPRLLEKVYEKIIRKGQELKGFKRNLFFWAVKLASRYDINTPSSLSYRIQLWIANKLIFSKWRAALGGKIGTIIVGGAACQQRLIRIFTAAGINVLEGYGLTETSPVIAVNRFPLADRKIGTVGIVLENMEVKFMPDGEIFCKGDNVMLGYFKKPEETAEVLHDGWLQTGDIGEMQGRFLKITDRKKEIFKTSGGKYVVPQPIENKMKENFLIEQIMVVGAGQKYTSALIVPNFAALQDWCEKNHMVYGSKEKIVQDPKVIQLYQSVLDRYNPLFNHVEQIKKFVLLPNEWTVDSGELTPSVKMRRKIIAEKYRKQIEAMYEPQGNEELSLNS